MDLRRRNKGTQLGGYVAIEISRRVNSCPNGVTCTGVSGVETSVSWENGNASENVCRRGKKLVDGNLLAC